MRLIFAKEAAEEMNVSPWYIASLKRAGAPFWGSKTSVADLEVWMCANPTFVAKHQWPARKLESRAPSKGRS